MSIESGGTALSHKAVAGTDNRFGKRPGRTEASGADGVAGFSLLMGMLSAADASTDDAGATQLTPTGESSAPAPMASVLPVENALVDKENVPPALYHQVFDAMKFIFTEGSENLSVKEVLDQAAPVGIAADMSASTTPSIQLNSPVPVGGAPLPLALPFTVPASVVASSTTESMPTVTVTLAAPMGMTAEPVRPQLPRAASAVTPQVGVFESQLQSGPIDALDLQSGVAAAGAATATDVRPTTHTPGIRVASTANPNLSIESRDTRAALNMSQFQVTTEANLSPLAGAMGEGMVRALDRSGNKLAGSRSGAGFDLAMGAAGGVSARADAPYQIEAAAAAVPDTAIAETVSYWVTHGVQSAELTLEGLGDEAVEVSISLLGDQALVDFRTDQPDIRRALEAANAQLRELLSNQGLQLAGMTIGSSGSRDAPNDGRQPRQQARLVASQAEPVVGGVLNRSANPSVGRSLDVFV
jgi:hypothetical protein